MAAAGECVFCAIEAEQPELVFWSTPDVVAFFDLNPLVASEAHVLVIPRRHSARLCDVGAADAAALGRALPVVARALLDVVGGTDFNVVQNNGPRAGQVVDHVHFHIVVRGKTRAALALDPAIVDSVRKRFPLRERLMLGATVFGKGLRTGQDDSTLASLAAQLRRRLAKL